MTVYILSQYKKSDREKIMPKDAVFTMKLEPSLRESFMAAAKANHRPASQVMRDLMREYIQRQRESQNYDDYIAKKVESGQQSIRAGEGISNEDVEQMFLARRNKLAGKI
ncbi:Uncharacterised protein [Leminorella richardii]|uniref:Antitoxin of toxin-antitoxin stability system n=1 Tax=Leminorella richardii TaxID=158841 RepID=A0A2X4V923_9GAMM|nr:antitoxin of toxin-antitoxin stability system [Leminorella richardii]SQI41810.1 Uncharacterised protein [Leminorella richardii]